MNDWLKAAQERRNLQWAGELPKHPAVVLEEKDRLMQLAYDRRRPKHPWEDVRAVEGWSRAVTSKNRLQNKRDIAYLQTLKSDVSYPATTSWK